MNEIKVIDADSELQQRLKTLFDPEHPDPYVVEAYTAWNVVSGFELDWSEELLGLQIYGCEDSVPQYYFLQEIYKFYRYKRLPLPPKLREWVDAVVAGRICQKRGPGRPPDKAVSSKIRFAKALLIEKHPKLTLEKVAGILADLIDPKTPTFEAIRSHLRERGKFNSRAKAEPLQFEEEIVEF